MKLIVLIGALAAAALSASTVVHAQPYPSSGYPQGGGYGAADQGQPSRPPFGSPDQGGYGAPGQDGGSDGGQGAGGPPPWQDLRSVLRLRPDQQSAYRAYQTQTAPDASAEQRAQAEASRLAAMTTPERLDLIVRQMQRDEADFAARSNAVRRFYAQLTPQQQHAFDRATAPPAPPAPESDQGGYAPPHGENPSDRSQGGPQRGYDQGASQGNYPPPR